MGLLRWMSSMESARVHEHEHEVEFVVELNILLVVGWEVQTESRYIKSGLSVCSVCLSAYVVHLLLI